MDDYSDFNRARWDALAAADVEWSRPHLDLDTVTARQGIDPYGVMGDVQGKRVLCLASGGGQQSAAFAVLGAHVTVLDFSEQQLAKDRVALAHYQVEGALVQGDMRDLSQFEPASFDVVWHAFSINFVADSGVVFDQVQRVIRPGGLYRMQWHNPFSVGVEESDWNGNGYSVKRRYQDGEVQFDTPNWVITYEDGSTREVEGPREFNHTLSTVINGLCRRGFVLLGFWEELGWNPDAEPGTWDHLNAMFPPWFTIWARYQPAHL
ncbi:MAG: class I SAM-dependent methyltransferase [Chloroflexi bacterium]|nr:class I SAM-dependent methyltransferase [Chloroflexota bacterium]